MAISDPPDALSVDPASLTAKELRLAQESLWEWIQTAEAAPPETAPDDEVLEEARQQLNAIIAERRDLHSDEPAPRGG